MNRPLILYSAISILSIGIILGSIYYWLGGFQKVNVYELQGIRKTVIGREFTGRSTSPQIVEYLNECRKLVLDSSIIGTVTRVVIKNDSLPANEVQYFIGVDIESEMAQAPLGFEIREFETSKRFAVFLDMNRWVRPSSKKIDHMIKQKATSLGYEIGGKVFEIYYIDDSMSVEGWVD